MIFLLMIIGMMALFSIQYSPEMVKSGQITSLVTSSSKYTIEYARKQPIVTFLGWEPFESTGDDQEDCSSKLNGLNGASPVEKNTGPVKEENADIGKTPCDWKPTSYSDSVVDRKDAIKRSPLKDGNLNSGKLVDRIPENNKHPEKIQDNAKSSVKDKPVLSVNKKESTVGRAKLQETKQPKKEMSAKKKEGKEPADWNNKYYHLDGREIPQIRPFEDGYHTNDLDQLLYNPETRWKILLILFFGFVAVFGIIGAVFLPGILKGLLVIYEKAKKKKTLRKTRRSKKQRRRPKTKLQEPMANRKRKGKTDRKKKETYGKPIQFFGFFPRVLFPWRYLVQFSCPFSPHYAGQFYN